MGNYYALELFSGDKRQIFFSEKGLPPSEFLTVFRPCDRAYPEFPSGFEDRDDPYIPSLAYVVSVPKLTERKCCIYGSGTVTGLDEAWSATDVPKTPI